MDGDGFQDLVWHNLSTGESRIWLMNGLQHTSTLSLPTEPDLYSCIYAIGDYNGDGSNDLLWRNMMTGENYVWYMSRGAFSMEVDLPAEPDTNWWIIGPH